MSILSTDKKLISFGTDYSAGSGISIIDHTISIVPSAVGKVYSAGPNISIYDVSGQPTISSKDWTQDIDQSSSGAVTESIDYLNTWINGQYTEDISNVTNNITSLSGDLSSYYKKTETSSKAEISAALDYVSAHAVGDVEVNNYVHNNSATINEVNSAYQSNSANYLTAVNLPESATWNETSNVVSSNSAQWSQGRTYEGVSPIVVNNYDNKVSADTWVLSAGDGVSLVDFSADKVTRIDCTATGDAGVNSFVTNNSASILDVNTSYTTNSGTFLTAIPSDVATTGDVANLEQTISNTYYPKSNPRSFATESWVGSQGYLTAHQDVSNKLDSSAFSSVSGDFLTTAFGIPESATWDEVSTTVQTNSAQWAEGGGGSVSSKFGTITVDGSDIEATNSAIEYKSNGFRSLLSIAGQVNPGSDLTYTWNDYSEGTTLTSIMINNSNDSGTLTYSSNTNVTGVITIPSFQSSSVILQLPNATAIHFTATNPYDLYGTEVLAASSFHVKELAWKNDLPTYTYNSDHKLSAINGNALVGNEDYLVEQGFVQDLSSPKGTISVLNNKIEGTNSAVKGDVIEGFVSAYGEVLVYQGYSATLTWDRYVPNATLTISTHSDRNITLTYSSNTNVTGNITLLCDVPAFTAQGSLELPTDSTSIVIGQATDYNAYNFTVSAEDYYEVGELAWKSDVPSYESTDDGLVSAIGSSGLYSTSADTANQTMNVLSNGNLGSNIDYSANGHRMVLNPTTTPFGTTSGIFNYLRYATGACLTYGSSAGTAQYFGGYYKGNEWMISNGQRGFALIGGYGANTGGCVHLSGATTAGHSFNLCESSVNGVDSSGKWKYGYEEDTLLRTLSSQIAYLSGVINQYHS